MFDSCCNPKGFTTKIRQELTNCLEKLEDYYPKTCASCILNDKNEMFLFFLDIILNYENLWLIIFIWFVCFAYIFRIVEKKGDMMKKGNFLNLLLPLQQTVQAFSLESNNKNVGCNIDYYYYFFLKKAQSIVKSESNIIHIKGTSRLFSYFVISPQYSLAFFTKFEPDVLESFDTSEPDAKILDITREILRILRSAK